MKIIKDLVEIVKSCLDIEKVDINDIPMMQYPKGHEDERKNFVNPFSKYNSRQSRIRYRR